MKKVLVRFFVDCFMTWLSVARQYPMSEVAEKRLEFVGEVREAVSIGQEVPEGHGELQTLDPSAGQGLHRPIRRPPTTVSGPSANPLKV